MQSESIAIDVLTRHVLNLDVQFHWITDSDRFWFERQTRTGHEYVVVNAATGQQSVASDAESLGVAGPSPHRVDKVASPDQKSAVLRHDEDLWIRNLSNGEERRLTRDGEPHFAYGAINPAYDYQQVLRRRTGAPTPVVGVIWSPDSRYVIALRQDFRPFPERLYVAEFAAPDGEYAPTHFRRVPIPRDGIAPESYVAIIDTADGTIRPAAFDRQAFNDFALFYLAGGIVWWSADGLKVFVITANHGGSRYGLSEVTLATGQTREVIAETGRTNVRLNQHDYARPNVYVSSNGKDVIWFSERSGYGHLYLFDAATGALKRQITKGDGAVFDLLRVDEANRLLYFLAGPRDAAQHPYYRHLYCIGWDGGEPRLLTPEYADHDFNNAVGTFRIANMENLYPYGSSISPTGRYFVDTYSTTDRPPKTVVRKISGELVAEILASDASDLFARGWHPPERFVVKAADGVTDLYGVMVRPQNFDPSKKYPVVDVTYPGPQGRYAPRNFTEAITSDGVICNLQNIANAGFVVVALDGRGTACRSRAFRDAFLRTEDAFGAADHVAAITNLAARHSCIDLDRVGITGESYGGYGSLRAFLLYPDFFKVAVSATGPGNWWLSQSPLAVERFFGVPSDSAEAAAYYDLASNTTLAARLKGKLLLIIGGIDENVPSKCTYVMVDALIKADKDFDLLVVPDSSHGVWNERYTVKRQIKYFVEHLAAR